MSSTSNPITTTKAWRLAKIPDGDINVYETFKLDNSVSLPSPLPEHHVLFEVLYLSNDPAQRTWIYDVPDEEAYMPPVRLQQPMTSLGVGRVVASANSSFIPGDLYSGFYSWSLHTVYNPAYGGPPLMKLPAGIDPADALALGLCAQTAYLGLTKWGSLDPKTDKLLVVSGAAGATGSMAIQMAKKVFGIETVWGIAGGAEKCTHVESVEVGADKCWDYKQPGWEKAFFLAAREKGFVNLYFDNVAGRATNTVLKSMAMFGKVVACGAIALYNKEADDPSEIGAEAWIGITTKKLRVQGFIYHQGVTYEDLGNAAKKVMGWAMEGKLKVTKTVWEAGFEEVPTGMEKLFKGDSLGKLVTKIKL